MKLILWNRIAASRSQELTKKWSSMMLWGGSIKKYTRLRTLSLLKKVEKPSIIATNNINTVISKTEKLRFPNSLFHGLHIMFIDGFQQFSVESLKAAVASPPVLGHGGSGLQVGSTVHCGCHGRWGQVGDWQLWEYWTIGPVEMMLI